MKRLTPRQKASKQLGNALAKVEKLTARLERVQVELSLANTELNVAECAYHRAARAE